MTCMEIDDSGIISNSGFDHKTVADKGTKLIKSLHLRLKNLLSIEQYG